MNIEISEEDWKVVEARLKFSGSNLKILIFGKTLTKNDLLKEVEEKSEIGKVYATAQLEYLKWCARGRS